MPSPLERIPGKIFAENASGVGNNPEIGQFGSAKSGAYLGTDNVREIQGTDAWSQGWTSAVVSSNNYPPLPEMNGVLKVLSYQICSILQQGIPFWDSETVYFKNNYVNYNGAIYFSTIDNNTTEPTTEEGGNNWQSGTIDLPIATLYSIGAVQPDGVSIGITPAGVISVLSDPIIDISHPIGDPIMTLNKTLGNNEIFLNGALVAKSDYPRLYEIYGDNYFLNTDKYSRNYSLTGTPTVDNNFIAYNFTVDNYLSLRNNFNPGTSSWTIELSFETPTYWYNSLNTLISGFSSSNYQLLLEISNDKKTNLYISGNGTSWNVLNNVRGEFEYEDSTWYDLRLSYSGGSSGTYRLQVKKTGTSYYTDDISQTSKSSMYSSSTSPFTIGISTNNTYPLQENMRIDLKTVVLSYSTTTIRPLTPINVSQLNNFRLLNCENMVPWGINASNSLGYINPSLPNIKGRIISLAPVNLSTNADGFVRISNAYATAGFNSGGLFANTGFSQVYFDGSYATPIYNNNTDTVIPPGFNVYWKTRYK